MVELSKDLVFIYSHLMEQGKFLGYLLFSQLLTSCDDVGLFVLERHELTWLYMTCLLYSPISAFADHVYTSVKILELRCILADPYEV